MKRTLGTFGTGNNDNTNNKSNNHIKPKKQIKSAQIIKHELAVDTNKIVSN